MNAITPEVDTGTQSPHVAANNSAAVASRALVSVIIPNFNFAEFVAQAIDSALALDWPAVEVIVVDDGSTDASRSVIENYGDRVLAIFTENRGQKAAYNEGFSRSSGEVVIFLDSDDMLEPTLIEELMTVWRPGISKVQFQMKVVDANGTPTGALLPQYHVQPTVAEVRLWARTAAAYPTPPGSGNAYSRTYLQKIFPLEGPDRIADSQCLAAAPFLGDVVTIAKPLVMYRVHGRNQGAMSELDPTRIGRELERARNRFRYGQSIARGAGISVSDAALDHSLEFLPYRLASLKLAPEAHPIDADGTAKVLRSFIEACFVPQGVPIRSRATLLVWATAVAFAPARIGNQLVLWRFASGSRPKLLKEVLRAFRVVKRHRS